jgi:hypothetical protein
MSKPKKYRVQATTTTYTYVYCWIAARQALKRAQEEERGSFYFNMMAGIFAAFTVEAFLNHLGRQQVSEWKEFERKLGPREKLVLLRRVLHFSADHSKRPFQTLYKMFRLRDALAHGRTATVATDLGVENPEDESANYPEPDWKKLCTLESASRMVKDAELIVRDLSAKTGSKRDPLASLGHGSSGVTLPANGNQ